MLSSSYLFYDLETTGLNPCFDQVLQFAAIRTDLELKELERFEIQVKLNPEIIPAPEALLTHRMSLSTMRQGELEVDAIRKIHRLMNQPGTLSLGYNTLGFDDEFLRFSFYRNLLPPYTHQYANQCSRMDIYPITVLYFLFKKEVIQWPEINGQVSLKLDHINQANHFVTGPAHEAMVDVEATLALARALKQQGEMWNYAIGYFNKNIDLQRLQKLPFSLKVNALELQEGLMVNGSFGSQHFFQAPVVSLGQHNHYRNQTLWLRLDKKELQQCSASTIEKNTFVLRKRAGEQPLLLPPKKRLMTYLCAERKACIDENRAWLQAHPDLLKKIIAHHRDYRYPINTTTDAQALLYELDFPSPFEEKRYRDFHSAKPENKESLIETFADNTRRELAFRLMGRFYPNALSPKNQSDYQNYCDQINSDNPPEDFRGEKQLNSTLALERIATLLTHNSLDKQQRKLLLELKETLTLAHDALTEKST